MTTPDTITVTTPSDTRGPIDLPSGPVAIDQPERNEVVDALRQAQFDLVDRLDLTPTTEETPVTGVRRRNAPALTGQQTVSIDVDTPPDQDAVVLVEQAGVYTWILPSEAGRPSEARSLAGARRFTFALSPSPASDAYTRGFLDELIYNKATALVLRYVAAPVGKAAISHFEDVEEGVVLMTPDGPAAWAPADPASLTIPPGGRMLLFVHGTFSSTANSFGPLWHTSEGRDLLVEANRAYDLVVGVDHLTLSLDPMENARRIVEQLRAIPGADGVVIDALGYSRGGLVLRSVIERVIPDSGWDATVNRAVFVGTTQRGTLLASPDHWHRLVDLYTNLVVAGATAVGTVVPGAAAPSALIAGGLKLIGAAVKTLATELIDEDTIPGLAAMLPEGPFVTELNTRHAGQPAPEAVDYFAVTSNFAADDATDALPSRMKYILKDGLMDRLMGEANDLVVNTSSMTGMQPGYLKNAHEFGTNGTVFHTNYFQQAALARALMDWWQLWPQTTAASPPPPVEPAAPPPAPTAPMPRRRRGGVVEPAQPSVEPAAEPGPREMRFSAGMDDPVVVGEVSSVEVRLGGDDVVAAAAAAGTGEVTTGDRLVIQVMCRKGFAPVGPMRVETDVPAEGTSELYFDVRATDPGSGHIDVVIRQGAVPILTLTLRPEIVAERPASAGVATGSGVAVAAEPLTAPLHQLRINERLSDGQVVYDFDFESEELGVLIAATSAPLKVDRAAYVAGLFSEIEQRWIGSGQDADNFRQDLRAYGASLFEELIPPAIQEALWEHRHRVEAIQVLSTEPFVPWEVVHLKEPGGPLGTEEHFLGGKGLVRWLHGSWPPDKIRVRPQRVMAVVPSYPEGTNFRLPEAEAELGYLQELFSATAVQPTVKDVRELLSAPGSFDLLHFAGHGTADQADVGNAKLMMEGRVEGGSYIPEYLNATTVAEFGNLINEDGNRPMVMINACQAGRAGYQLTGIGGFAAAFTRAGAGAFVSSLWSVGDRPARTFTERFYQSLLAGSTVTDAVVESRRAAADAGDATWLAYTVYAHPHARLVPG